MHAHTLTLMKPSAFLINIARGRHVVTDALVAALQAGQLAEGGLDVTDPEPLPASHPLHSLPHVEPSPHVTAQSEQVQRESCHVLCESIAQAIVNPLIYE